MIVIIAIETKRIQFVHQKLARIPPIAGQIRNAVPKAAPIIPIFFVFSAGAEISDIYACTTQNPAPPIPAITLAER